MRLRIDGLELFSVSLEDHLGREAEAAKRSGGGHGGYSRKGEGRSTAPTWACCPAQRNRTAQPAIRERCQAANHQIRSPFASRQRRIALAQGSPRNDPDCKISGIRRMSDKICLPGCSIFGTQIFSDVSYLTPLFRFLIYLTECRRTDRPSGHSMRLGSHLNQTVQEKASW